MRIPALFVAIALLSASTAQAAVPTQAALDIDKANADWGLAMQKGDPAGVVAAYAPDAVFCSRDGKCFSGFAAIAAWMVASGATAMASLARKGPMQSAEAHTTRRVEDHGYIYEWGQAKMVDAAGKTVAGGYFTIWAKQPDGHWKIFRNIVMP